MSNGVNGCGVEYQNHGGHCQHLEADLGGYICKKYNVGLVSHFKNGHPIRLAQCKDDANRNHETQHLKKIASETLAMRGHL